MLQVDEVDARDNPNVDDLGHTYGEELEVCKNGTFSSKLLGGKGAFSSKTTH